MRFRRKREDKIERWFSIAAKSAGVLCIIGCIVIGTMMATVDRGTAFDGIAAFLMFIFLSTPSIVALYLCSLGRRIHAEILEMNEHLSHVRAKARSATDI